MQCLIALDGISSCDLPALLEHLPRSGKYLQGLPVTKLNCSSNSAQVIWAELLTGAKSFSNGCAGYSYPTTSLNSLSVFTEKNLLVPARLVEVASGSTAVTINVPILMPQQSNRMWLSDGSLPINRTFSPSSLRSDDTLRRYLPRPYKSHAGATTLSQSSLIEACLENETQRLDCSIALFKRGSWSKFIYRLSLFDYLSHLIGLNFLAATDLSAFHSIEKFLKRLDLALEIFSSENPERLTLLSGFGHVLCEGTLNLNLLLAHGGFLELASGQTSSTAHVDRMRAVSAISKSPPSSHFLESLEGRLDTSQTVAGSPVSGCVYINKSTLFDDGIVPENDYKRVRSEVCTYLHKVLSQQLGQKYSLEVHPDEVNNTCAPDLIVKIEGIEFQNLSATMSPVTPLTTHSAEGFALLPTKLQAPEQMSPSQLATLLND